MIKRLKDLVPLLLDTTQKGYNGKVAVIGGCTEYTGAPYFLAISAVYGGAYNDFIFCTKNASITIKSYSPKWLSTQFFSLQKTSKYMNLNSKNRKLYNPLFMKSLI